MKHNLKIIVLILLSSLLFNSCKKDAQWSSIDPNLEGGKWVSYYTSSGRGSTLEFSNGNFIDLRDKADGSSIEDDFSAGGKAKVENNVIISGYTNRDRFKIEEYPVRFDTTIISGVGPQLTKGRMKIRFVKTIKKNINWNKGQLYIFYKE